MYFFRRIKMEHFFITWGPNCSNTGRKTVLTSGSSSSPPDSAVFRFLLVARQIAIWFLQLWLYLNTLPGEEKYRFYLNHVVLEILCEQLFVPWGIWCICRATILGVASYAKTDKNVAKKSKGLYVKEINTKIMFDLMNRIRINNIYDEITLEQVLHLNIFSLMW